MSRVGRRIKNAEAGHERESRRPALEPECRISKEPKRTKIYRLTTRVNRTNRGPDEAVMVEDGHGWVRLNDWLGAQGESLFISRPITIVSETFEG
jgi:hypothetical protein